MPHDGRIYEVRPVRWSPWIVICCGVGIVAQSVVRSGWPTSVASWLVLALSVPIFGVLAWQAGSRAAWRLELTDTELVASFTWSRQRHLDRRIVQRVQIGGVKEGRVVSSSGRSLRVFVPNRRREEEFLRFGELLVEHER